MKRFLLATGAGIAATAAIAASAASLGTITGSEVGSNTRALTSACFQGAVEIQYDDTWVASTSSYSVSGVAVNAPVACATWGLEVSLVDDSTTPRIGIGNGTLDGSGDDTVTINPPAEVQELNEIAILLTEPN